MDIKQVQVHACGGIQPAADHVLARGNGRRITEAVRAKTPESITISAHADSEARLTGKSMCDSMLAINFNGGTYMDQLVMPIVVDNLKPTEALVVVMGSADGSGRPNNSKLLLHQGEVYAFLTWTDLFGYSVKESAPQRTAPFGDRYVPLRKMSDDVKRELMEALRRTINVTV